METLLPTLTFLTLLSQILAATLSATSTVGIVGGKNVTIAQYPYQISVLANGEYICGGSILNEFYVLTSATCPLFLRPEWMTVRAGSSFVDHGGIIRNVVEIFMHPKFNIFTSDSNIGILKLDTPLIFNRTISPIKLPQQNTSNSSTDGLIGEVTGWGQSSDDGPLSKQLQMIKVPTVPQSICYSDYKDTKLKITDTMLCAGIYADGKGVCRGDDGDPFVVNGTVIGIAIAGHGCADPTFPSVYTRVSYFVDYIKSIMSK